MMNNPPPGFEALPNESFCGVAIGDSSRLRHLFLPFYRGCSPKLLLSEPPFPHTNPKLAFFLIAPPRFPFFVPVSLFSQVKTYRPCGYSPMQPRPFRFLSLEAPLRQQRGSHHQQFRGSPEVSPPGCVFQDLNIEDLQARVFPLLLCPREVFPVASFKQLTDSRRLDPQHPRPFLQKALQESPMTILPLHQQF